MGKDSGSSTPQTQTVVNSSLPPELLPYAKDILNQGESLSNQPYVPYQGQQLADQSQLTQQAYNQAGQLGSVGSGAIDQAGNAFQSGLQGAMRAGQNSTAPTVSSPTYQSQQYNYNNVAPAQYAQANTINPTQYNYNAAQAQQYGTPQASGVNQVHSGSWLNPGMAGAYMSPYEQNVLSSQLGLANTQFGEQQNVRNSDAISQGTFGGDRAALVNEAAQRDFNNSENQMIAQGLNTAYTTGQQAYQADNSANLLSQEANQQANQNTQNTNVQAALNTNALNAGNYNTITSLNANQNQANNALNASQINAANSLNSSNYNTTNALNSGNIQSAQALNAQYNQANNALNSSNYNTTNALNSQNQNANNSLNSANYNTGISNLLNAAGLQNQIGNSQSNLGQTQQNMASTGLNALYAAGQSAQNYQQQGLNIGYNNFVNQQQYPEQQLNFLSGLMHGFNVSPNSYSNTASTYQNPITQLVGAGTGLAGIASALGGKGG